MPAYTIQSEYPVPVVKVVVVNDRGEILLLERSVEPFIGKWTIPGARMGVHDDCIESRARQEVKEQTGFDVDITHLLAVRADSIRDKLTFDPRFFIVKVIYVARLRGGSERSGAKTRRVGWFALPQALKMKQKIGFDHAEILALYKEMGNRLLPVERSRYTEWYGREFPYAERRFVRLACMGIILNERKEILLGLKARKPFADYWNFPGGHLYVGETPEACLEREISEELGVGSATGQLFGVYSDNGQHPKHADIGVYYFAEIKSQSFIKNIEMKDFGYFPLDRLPGNIAYQNRMVLEDIRKRIII